MGLFSSEKTGPIEKSVNKATDESLTRENWSYIIDVCNKVNESPESGGREAVNAIRKRLESRNGNIQLYSLTLLNALAQNCGTMIHREIASTVTCQALQKLGTSPHTHRSVVVRLLEILDGLSQQFEADPSLKQVSVTLDRVKHAHPHLVPPPPAPTPPARARSHSSHKASVNVPVDDEEDEDLKRALELSLQEAQPASMPVQNQDQQPGSNQDVESKPSKVKALYDFTATEPGELTFRAGDVITVIEGVYKDWWRGSIGAATGIFPVNYVEAMPDLPVETPVTLPSQASIASTPQPQQDEAYIFAQAPTVEKLLSIFATASQHPGYGILGNQDVQRLYHEVSAMRPRLLQLIDEYSRKKDDLMALNSQLLEARRSYNRLIDSAQQQQQQQHQLQQHQQQQLQQPQFQQQSQPYEQPVLNREPLQQPGYTYAPTPSHQEQFPQYQSYVSNEDPSVSAPPAGAVYPASQVVPTPTASATAINAEEQEPGWYYVPPSRQQPRIPIQTSGSRTPYPPDYSYASSHQSPQTPQSLAQQSPLPYPEQSYTVPVGASAPPMPNPYS